MPKTHTFTQLNNVWNVNADFPSKSEERFKMSKHKAAWQWYSSRRNDKKRDFNFPCKTNKTWTCKSCLTSSPCKDLLTNTSPPVGWKRHFLWEIPTAAGLPQSLLLWKDSRQNSLMLSSASLRRARAYSPKVFVLSHHLTVLQGYYCLRHVLYGGV